MRYSAAGSSRLRLAPIPNHIGSPLASTQTGVPRRANSISKAASNGLGQTIRSCPPSGTSARCRRPPINVRACRTALRACSPRPQSPSSPIPTTSSQSGITIDLQSVSRRWSAACRTPAWAGKSMNFTIIDMIRYHPFDGDVKEPERDARFAAERRPLRCAPSVDVTGIRRMSAVSVDISETRRKLRASACPSLFRITPARDGGLCRIKLPPGHLAAGAARFGNGIIEVTNRANLQIRGIGQDGETALILSLLAAGLGPVRPEAEDIRNVMASPTAGIDPLQHIDALPLARDLLVCLQRDREYDALSAKFSFMIDGGEGVAAIDHPHDVWLASMGGAMMALGFAGSPPLSAGDKTPFVAIPLHHAVAAVALALSLFLEAASRGAGITRFRHLFARTGQEEFCDRLSASLGTKVRCSVALAAWRRQRPAFPGHLGIREQRQSGLVFIGAAPPLGRLSPYALMRLAALAEERGDGSLRLTPWHSVIVPSVRRDRAEGVAQALEALGLICDPGHPLAAIVACPGSRGCAAAMSDTKADALALAQIFGSSAGALRQTHLSGCPKSCASVRVAEFTLVASSPGIYELFRRTDGGDGGFGRLIGRGLSVEEAGARIGENVSRPPADAAGGAG